MFNAKGTVYHPSVLQLNLDNINRLPHSKYPNRKKQGNVPARDSNPRHSVCKADAQTIRPPVPAPRIYRSVTNVTCSKNHTIVSIIVDFYSNYIRKHLKLQIYACLDTDHIFLCELQKVQDFERFSLPGRDISWILTNWLRIAGTT